MHSTSANADDMISEYKHLGLREAHVSPQFGETVKSFQTECTLHSCISL